MNTFKGKFISTESEICKRLSGIRAFVFDWDGVFNSGVKNEEWCSTFSEIDSMGTNLLRFHYFLGHESCPKMAIITGENNKISMNFAKREHFDQLYYRAKNKKIALEHFCTIHQLKPEQIAFVFDDVLDLNVAAVVGLRIMIGRDTTPMFEEFVIKKNLTDYITHFPGNKNGVRETTELLMSLSGNFDQTIQHRMDYSKEYQNYIELRNKVQLSILGPDEL